MILIVVMLRIVREGGCGEGRRGAGPAVITAGVGVCGGVGAGGVAWSGRARVGKTTRWRADTDRA